MIRPSSLIRNDDEQIPRFEAQASNIKREFLDCGITACGCCNNPSCQKMGTVRTFLTVLVIAGIVQSGVEVYFKISAQQAALELGYNSSTVNWLLVTSGIAQGLFAILIAYWGDKIHKVSWLGAIFMLQAVTCFLVIIPTVTHNDDSRTIAALKIDNLCTERETENLEEERPYSVTTLVMLFFAQIAIGCGNVAFYTLGLSYMDDNLKEHESPGFIASAMASRFLGHPLGMGVVLLVGVTPLGWWLGWVIIAPIVFIVGLLISLFPKRLLSTVVRQAADDIIGVATTSSQLSLHRTKWLADISFFESLRRVLTNKILLLNIMAVVFVQSGIVNFQNHEQSYLQSRFFLPTTDSNGINDEWTSRLIVYFLKPPIMALAIITAGLIIAKSNPSPRKIVMWNILSATKVLIIFIAYIFIDCQNGPVAGAYRDKLTKPFCASSCLCPDNIPFSPVCPENSVFTYYSPCHAGCSSEYTINNVKVYGNCSCGVDTEIPIFNGVASNGACSMDNCQKFWITFQTTSVIAAGLLASCLIGKLVITIRSVLPQDKSLALGLEMTFVGLIVYIPGNISYQALADKACQFWSHDQNHCFLHESPYFGNIITILTACLIFVGIIFEIFVYYCVDDLLLYGDEEPDDVFRPIQMQRVSSLHSQNTRTNQENLPEQPPDPQSENLLSNTLNNNNNNNDSTYFVNNHQNSRSISPIVSSSVTYAEVIRQIPVRATGGGEEDDHLEFMSAEGDLRTDFEELNFEEQQATPTNSSLQSGSLNIPVNSGYGPIRKGGSLSPETNF